MAHSFSTTAFPGDSDRFKSDAQVLHAAHHLVEIYLVYLREHETGSDVFDTNELPASKEALVNAFRVVIATESRPGVRTLLMKAGMTLAHYQEDIGPRMSVRPAPLRAKMHDGQHRADPKQIHKFDRALNQMCAERTRLVQVFQHASRIAEKKPHHHS